MLKHLTIPRALALLSALAIVASIVLAQVYPTQPQGEVEFGTIERVDPQNQTLTPEQIKELYRWHRRELHRLQLTTA